MKILILFFTIIVLIVSYGYSKQIGVELASPKVNSRSINTSTTLNSTEKLQQWFPYFLSGYDYESRPVIVVEYGKWKIRQFLESEGPEAKENLGLYFSTVVENLHSILKRSKGDGMVIIMDYEDFSYTQVNDSQFFKFLQQQNHKAQTLKDKVSYGYFVNVNFVADNFIKVAQAFMGPVFERFEVYGTNSKFWIPKILRNIPREQLPPWMGGLNDYKPIAVYG